MTHPTFDRWLLAAGGLIALLVAAAALTFWNTRQLNEDAGWVAHTHEVMDTLEEVSGHLREAEAIQRTYLITGGDAPPPEVADNVAAARQKVGHVKWLTRDNEEQQKRVPGIEDAIDELAAAWVDTMAVRKEKGFGAAKEIVENGRSRRLMTDLERRVRDMHDAEQALLRDRAAKTERSYRVAQATGLLSGLAAVAGVVAVMVLLQRHFAARRAAEASAAAAEQAQREERRQREQLHVTLSSIGDAVIVTDKDGAVTFLNPVAQNLTGWAPQEAAGRPLEEVFRIVNEETRRPVESPVRRVLREGATVGLANHTILIARDGREIPIDDSGAPIRGDDGAVGGVVLVFRDVTEARRAVEARLHLAAIVESSDDAIISKSLDGVIQSWNAGAERLFGFTAAEAVGRHISLITPPDLRDEEDRIIADLKAGRRLDHYETVRVRQDGTRVDVSLTISPVRNADGQVVGASKITRDITAAKRAEGTLRFLADASKLLSELLDVPSTLDKVAGLSVPRFADWCAVDMLGPDGTLRRVAVAHADPAKVELARGLQRRFPPDPAAARGVWNILRTGAAELIADVTDPLLDQAVTDPDLRAALRELGLRSYMGVPLPVRGRPVGVLTFIAAESGRRFGPDDLRLAEDLAQRAGVAVENARLYGELKEAGRQKDEFLAMLAHELRNPLAPVRNALQVMKMPGADVEQARGMAERQVAHMVRLVDDLLDVSRIMRGRIELRKEPVELAAVLAQAAETAQPMLDAHGQELVLSAPPEPLWLEADPARLAQVVANLLHNAAKFSGRAGRVWLTAERRGDEAVVRVRDEGAGIRADVLPRVFDLFVQGDRSLERTQGGLGIGLTVVRKLVAMHGGTVTAASEGPGRGSEFVVRLPGVREAPAGAGAAEEAQAPAALRRVLVVDDNVDAAESIGMLLRLWGHEVRVAYNGPQALEAADEYRPEVVVLDIGLPGMSGYEVARQLRQRPQFKTALLVAVTGYGQDEDRRRSGEAGFDHHLTKPVDPDALHALLAS
jgi:PAS domain S-box-containing protein